MEGFVRENWGSLGVVGLERGRERESFGGLE